MQYVVYADILWLINFMMDFMLLWCTGHFGGFHTAWYRLCLAAVLGGLYGVGMVFPGLSLLYITGVKLLFPVVLLFVAFGRLGWRRFGKAFLYFYLLSFAMSGAVMGGSALFTRYGWLGRQAQPIHMMTLLFGVFAAVLLGRFGLRYVKQNLQRETHLTEVKIKIEEKETIIRCMLDTGNALKEPISGNAVMVVEYQAIKKLLTKEFCYQFEKKAGEKNGAIRILNHFMLAATGNPTAGCLALVPFTAVGKSSGMLLGLRPGSVSLRHPETGQWMERQDVVLGLYDRRLGSGFQGIVNPAVFLEQGQAIKNQPMGENNKGERKWKIGA